jgi:aminopeptidase N
LLTRARAANGTLEKDGSYEALMSAADPAIAQRALDVVFDSDVPVMKTTDFIEVTAIMHPELVWRFSVQHDAELSTRLDSLSRADFFPGITATGVEPQLLRDLRTYIDTQVPADVRRGAEEAYLRLEERIATRREKLPELDHWLAAPQRGSGSSQSMQQR